jgi:hypothetical protein
MPAPAEHKTVQAQILACAQEIGWTYVSREEAERRRGFEPRMTGRMNKDTKKLALEHSQCEWGRAKTKSLQAGLTNFCFFSASPARGIIRANPSNPWLASPQLCQPVACLK